MRRVLQMIETAGPGGAETILLSLVSGLKESGWEVIPVLKGPGWLEDQIRSVGVPSFRLETSGSFDVRLMVWLGRLIRRESVDLVHTHLQGSTVYGSLGARVAGVPVLGTFHGFPDLDFHGTSGWLKKFILHSLPTQLTFVSEALKSRAHELGIVSRGRSLVIGNGIDLSCFHPTQSKSWCGRSASGSEPFVVGSVGNLRPAKDYEMLLRAASKLNSESRGEFRFAVYGQRSEPLHSHLLALRSELGLSGEGLQFRGFVSDVSEALAGLDALVISSRSEGFSLAAVQAMAAGVPVISTRCGGPEEIIEDGVDGLLVPVGSPGALAEAIRMVGASSDLRMRLARAGRRKVEEKYSLPGMVSSYARVYDRILGR